MQWLYLAQVLGALTSLVTAMTALILAVGKLRSRRGGDSEDGGSASGPPSSERDLTD